MKRKADAQIDPKTEGSARGKKHKTSLSPEEAEKRFRKGLFDQGVLESYTEEYATSVPYKHAVIDSLTDDKLLRSVRDEIRNNVHFTPKETDIYKIHQSGDLANLDGLDDESLSKLPSLLALRDAIYSDSFRNYVSHITACGPLSGRKTDMAINVYTPGCYLLCHDDVIGSRRVSYILYLTDPDKPWKPEWGGALRLFPVQEIKSKDGEVAKTPLPDVTKTIPPAWNQLSFFAVQPGESFHDVEEVYHATSKEQLEKDGGRVRMAISGWFHIPQIGEEGYIEGEEEQNAKNSSLMQLQGNPAQYDAPQSLPVKITKSARDDDSDFTESDLEFLLKYIAPTYLTPDVLEQISAEFEEVSSISLPSILSKKFAARLRSYVEAQDKAPLPDNGEEIEKKTPWKVARPPHKHRYLYQRPSGPDELRTSQEESPITELLDVLLPSRQFRRWLQIATGCVIENHDIIARRFRPGKDYTLAMGHEGQARLELNLGITPSSGWSKEDEEEDDAEEDKTKAKKNGSSSKNAKDKTEEKQEEDDVGGIEVYMAGADDSAEDAAVYNSAANDDNILFFQNAAWNNLSIVLRDGGTLKFVKYVSQKAEGSRWDISGSYDVEDLDDDDDDEENGGPAPADDSDDNEPISKTEDEDSDSD